MNTENKKFSASQNIKEKQKIFSDKRGILMENLIFLILNAVFFVVLIIFIWSNVDGRPAHEQAYAKQIALLIDEAKPTMTFSLDMQEVVEEYDKELSEIVKIDNNEKKVIVKLGSRGGYSYRFFTDAKIESKVQEKYNLIVNIKKNE
jgi:hypothetical protein